MAAAAALLASALLVSCAAAAPEKAQGTEPPVLPVLAESPQEPQATPEAEPDAPFLYGYNGLSEAEKDVYAGLYALAEAIDTSGAVDLRPGGRLSQTEPSRVLSAFFDDNPQFYWAQAVVGTAGEEPEQVRLDFRAGFDYETVLSQQREIGLAASALLEGLDGGAAEVAAALHDKLAAHVTYDLNAPKSTVGTVYGGLVNRAGVCDDYAKSYAYLLRQKGIACIYIRGTERRGRAHAWNAVLLEDGWYYVDVTWDSRERLSHKYMFMSLEEAAREHLWDVTQYPMLPESGGGACDYFAAGGYAVAAGVPAARLAGAMAAAFAAQLAARASREGEELILEIKVMGAQENYLRAKELFYSNPFNIVDIANMILDAKGAAFRIMRGDAVTLYCSDEMRILSLYHPRRFRYQQLLA
jgi:hypothetical protein